MIDFFKTWVSLAHLLYGVHVHLKGKTASVDTGTSSTVA